MPLTGPEKTQLVSLSTTVASQQIATSAGLGLLGAGGIGIIFLPLILGLTAQFNRQRFPKAPPLHEQINQLNALRRRGLEPRTSSDPFFGNVVISTRDQDRNLSQFVQDAAIRQIRSEFDFSPIARQREALIGALARTAPARGFRTSIDPNLRGGVFRETAESPLQFIEGDFL